VSAGGNIFWYTRKSDRWRANKKRLRCLFASQIGRKPAQKNSPSEKSKIGAQKPLRRNHAPINFLRPGTAFVCFALPRLKNTSQGFNLTQMPDLWVEMGQEWREALFFGPNTS
jgi:hypothetical protein